MKRVIAACIDQLLEFDSEDSYEEYIKDLESKKQWFRIFSKDVRKSGKVIVRVKKQYNRHIWEF